MWGEVLKTQEIFKNFLTELADAVSPSTYSVWFNDLELISMDDKKIVIKVPLPVHKQILKTTYIELFDEIMFSLTAINYEFEFLTEDEIEEIKEDQPLSKKDFTNLIIILIAVFFWFMAFNAIETFNSLFCTNVLLDEGIGSTIAIILPISIVSAMPVSFIYCSAARTMFLGYWSKGRLLG